MARNDLGLPPKLPDTAALPSRLGPAARQLLASGQGGGNPAATSVVDLGGRIQIFPWYIYEYPSAQDFTAQAVNFAAAANTTTTATGFTFTCPSQNVAVLRQVTVTVQNILAASDVRWSLTKNGAPVPGWTQVSIAPCAATAIIIPYNDMVVRLAQGDVLGASITETGGNAYTCTISGAGWFVPVSEVARLQNGLAL
jgi:hypothetical protein